ncbi:Uncharacterised protein [uncultured Clostridium sp.]|nr:Uncharacterised protein [uncultured Clostridium sp.]SCJ49707.1 Uncharacterised protein [uncultured Clostridium sp.]
MSNRTDILNTDDTEHLKYLQDIIKRMADNSFKIKGWSITITGGLLALLITNNKVSVNDLLVVYVPIIGFWLIDSYYLKLERVFRSRYENDVQKIKDEDYDNIKYFSFGKAYERKTSKEILKALLDIKRVWTWIKKSYDNFLNYISAVFSISMLLTYIPMCISVLLIMHILKG